MDKSKALTWTELRVGLVVIGSLVMLALTVLYIGGSAGGSPFASRFEVKALMTDVNGLKSGAPVRVGGLEVGTVTGVDFAKGDRSGMVEVKMRLDKKVQGKITTKSEANLGAVGLLGEKAVDIMPSAEGAPVQDGGYLASTGSDPFKSLMTDTSETTHHLKRILARMDAGEGLIGKALRDEELYDRMTDVSIRLQGVLSRLEATEGPLGRLVNDREMSRQMASSMKGINTVVARLEQGQGTIGGLMKDEQVLRDLKSLTASLGEVTSGLQAGRGTAGKLLTDDALHTKLDSAVTRLDTAMQRLESGQGSAGRLLNDPSFYENLNAAATELRSLVADVRKDPRKYLRVKVSVF